MKTAVALLCLGFALAHQQKNNSEPTIWALLVAGSNTWYNYRHQADLCHAYQILHRHGVPDENIVVMMYDDIAENRDNPTPGIIINHPKGKDVYRGVPKDYTREDVTPENFLNILQGNAEAMRSVGSGKVIQSGPNDHVFVNFVDHGATGLVAFPNGELTVNELKTALLSMHREKKYSQMVLYIEACESGSMFRHWLKNNMKIYATTAANYNESSYACYYDEERQTFLGDWYSVHWMENSDKVNLHKETLIDQFRLTKRETNTSHCQEYGDLSMAREPVADFQGEKRAEPIYYPRKRVYVQEVYRTLVKRLSTRGSLQVFNMIKNRPDQITELECHDKIVHGFSRHCFNFGQNPYALKYAYILANICEEGFAPEEVVDLMRDICRNVQSIPGGIH